MVREGSVGFLRVRPVIHPLFWANPLNQASEDPGAVGEPWLPFLCFLVLCKGPCIGQGRFSLLGGMWVPSRVELALVDKVDPYRMSTPSS